MMEIIEGNIDQKRRDAGLRRALKGPFRSSRRIAGISIVRGPDPNRRNHRSRGLLTEGAARAPSPRPLSRRRLVGVITWRFPVLNDGRFETGACVSMSDPATMPGRRIEWRKVLPQSWPNHAIQPWVCSVAR